MGDGTAETKEFLAATWREGAEQLYTRPRDEHSASLFRKPPSMCSFGAEALDSLSTTFDGIIDISFMFWNVTVKFPVWNSTA